MKMIDSTLHGSVYCGSPGDFTSETNESELDENGNISTKFPCDYKGSRPCGEFDLKCIISQHIETMFEYFPRECSKYIWKMVSFKSLPNELICNNIGTFLNVFIECIRCCLKCSDDFKMFRKLREGIVSVLVFVNNFKNSIRKDQVDKNWHTYKIYVVFGLLIDVELLASSYHEEELVMIKNRLLTRIDNLLEALDDVSLAIFNSTEFLNASVTKNNANICVPIIVKVLQRNLPVLSRILLFKLWENFSKNSPFENMPDFSMEIIRKEDVMGLQKFSPVFFAIPEDCENIASLLLNTNFDVPQTVQAYVKAQEEIFEIDFTIPERDFLKSCANDEEAKNNCYLEEKSEERVDITPILEVVGNEHDYCSRSSLNCEKFTSEQPTGILSEVDRILHNSEEERSGTDERVEIELCDLCVELGTLAIDSCAIEEIPYLSNEEQINSSNARLVSEPLVCYTDPLYRLHYCTCEADEKCFSQQYDYIMLCKDNVDLEPSKLPEVTFLEEPRCQCQSCHNNLECLKKNLSMLTEYARKRREKIEELSENRSKLDIEFNGLVANYQHERIPPEYKRSASETLEHKLPLKKRKFSLDEA